MLIGQMRTSGTRTVVYKSTTMERTPAIKYAKYAGHNAWTVPVHVKSNNWPL